MPTPSTTSAPLSPALLPRIESHIVVLRGLRLMIDAALAALNGVTTKRPSELEQKADGLALTHDTFSRNTRTQLRQLIEAVNRLMAPPDPPKRPIGFVTPERARATARPLGLKAGVNN